MEILKQLREEGRPEDMQALMEHIPFARFLGVQADIKGNEITMILPFQEKLIGNPILPAIHGGAIGAFLEITAVIQLLFITQCERIPKRSIFQWITSAPGARWRPTAGRS